MLNSLDSIYLPIPDVKPRPRPVRVHNRKQRRKLKALFRRASHPRTLVNGHAVHAALIERVFNGSNENRPASVPGLSEPLVASVADVMGQKGVVCVSAD